MHPARSPRSRLRRHPRPGAVAGLAALLLGLAGGCSQSRWAASFEPAPAYGTAGLVSTAESADDRAASEPASVEIREIPWERMAQVLDEEAAALTAADEHPADWGEDRLLTHRAMLLNGLQVQGDPARIEIIGRSSFRGLGAVRPRGTDRADVERQARAVGADAVIVATTFLGRVDTIEDRPVTTFGFGGSYARGRYDGRTGIRSGTTWVPVRAEADQIGVVAFFLRRLD